MSDEKIELNLGEPRLYVLLGKQGQCGNDIADLHPTRKIRKIHVISPAAGGEVRGYWDVDGEDELRLSHPLHPQRWPEVDAEVSRVLGRPVRQCDAECETCDGKRTVTFYVDRDSDERETEPCPDCAEVRP